MTRAIDLAQLSENGRIRKIGEAAGKALTGMYIDDEPEKIARYIRKLEQRHPLAMHIDTFPLTPGVVLLRFGPRERH